MLELIKTDVDFYKEVLDAIEKLDEKKLCRGDWLDDHCVPCAIGALLQTNGIDPLKIIGIGHMAATLNAPSEVVRKIIHANDLCENETQEDRYDRMVEWLKEKCKQAS